MTTINISRNHPLRFRLQPWLCLGLVVASLALTLFSSPLVSMGSWNEFKVDMVGWLIFVLGGAMRWWTALYRMEGNPPQLAVRGPYSICRHPLQLGTLLFCISLACFLGSVTCLVGFAVAATVYFSLAIPAEERKLREKFGMQYERYCQVVPMLWPRFRLFQTPENIHIDVSSLAHELRRMAIWMWLPAIARAAAQCHSEGWWPHVLGVF
ncbi:MAG TPA: isoprenylcysteine carboxylmethyltransferase family protein [Pirellulales bacterium]|jgi:protein-S-isoprenylcysteine O-methyltransferase Ste14|nr:isoprenylcysteine carboxylmethyltransferase family protein [Pirellulales bacterium]